MTRPLCLEFQHETGAFATLGSDCLFYPDGRWSRATLHEKIYERVAEMRQYRNDLLFVGYAPLSSTFNEGQIVRMHDPHPPAWAKADRG